MNQQIYIACSSSENKPRGLYFSNALFEGLIFGGAYLWRDICVSKSIGLALWLEVNLLFLLCFTLYLRAIFQVQAPGGGLYLEGQFNGGFFALPVWGAYIWRGFYMEGLIFWILRYKWNIEPNLSQTETNFRSERKKQSALFLVFRKCSWTQSALKS